MTYILEYLHRRRIFWVLEQSGPELSAAQCANDASCSQMLPARALKLPTRGLRPV